MASKQRIVLALLLCLLIVMAGVLGYTLVEGYSLPDALYMTIITVSTVGFAEVRPLSHVGRVITAALILTGFASLAFVGHAVMETLLSKTFSGARERNRMKKQISRLDAHYIICGFGRVGGAAADHLRTVGVEFVIIESDPTQCRLIREKGLLFVEGDGAGEEALMEAGVKNARGLLAVLPSDPDNLFTMLNARELNPTLQLIARAEDPSSEQKLLRAGADSVISPFKTAGTQIARSMLAATGRGMAAPAGMGDAVTLTPEWIDVEGGSSMVGQTLASLSQEMGRRVIGLRQEGKDILTPDPGTTLAAGDQVLVMVEPSEGAGAQWGEREQPKRVLLVDDNPVVLRLYARLLRRAGLACLTATDGAEALESIRREGPDAAVIDIMLPILSGIDICRRVRAMDSCRETKLILFTADTHAETRQAAMEAGADAFLIKSPEATKLVQTVIDLVRSSPAGEGADPAPQTTSSPDAQDSGSGEPGGRCQIPPDVFDRDAALDAVAGDLSILQEVADLFLVDTPQLMSAIEDAIEEEDGPTLRQAAHSLKGSLGSFAARRAMDCAQRLETMGRDSNMAQTRDAYQALAREIERLRPALTALSKEGYKA